MYTITLCSSSKFKVQARKFAKQLKNLGLNVYEAVLFNHDDWDKIPEKDKLLIALGGTHGHFHKIRKSDAIFVLNIGGYIGPSVNMEIGFAVALNKKIFFMEAEENEYARKILSDGVAKTPKELVKRIKSVQTPDILD